MCMLRSCLYDPIEINSISKQIGSLLLGEISGKFQKITGCTFHILAYVKGQGHSNIKYAWHTTFMAG